MNRPKAKLYAWRPIQREDLALGLLIKWQAMIDSGAYGMMTVIGIHDSTNAEWKHIKVARPMAYGKEAFSTNQPMLTVEVFEISFDILFFDKKNNPYEVFVQRNGCSKLTT